MRESIDNAPLFLMSSPKMGSGKGLLVNMIAQIATGSEAVEMSQTSDENEERKRIMVALVTGNSIICIDNIERNFQSETLCGVLTMSKLTDRLLGKTQMVSASTKATFLATGNNVTVVGDLTRRVLPVVIDPKTEKPYERQFTRHLPSYMEQHRPDLVVAALTILRAYHIAGKPKQNLTAFGSFEQWSGSIRGALVWCGLDDPCRGLSRWEAVDPVRTEVANVLESWYSMLKSESVTCNEVIKEVDIYMNSDNNYEEEVEREKFYAALLAVSEKGGVLMRVHSLKIRETERSEVMIFSPQ